MSKFKYYNSLNLFEGVLTEYDVNNPVHALGHELGILFQSNPTLLRSVMNRLSAYPKDIQMEKIKVALDVAKRFSNHLSLEVHDALIRALDADDKSTGTSPNYAPEAPPREDRRQNRK